MKLVIDRKRWLHGEPGNGLLLRTRDGKMCCLGFYCEALGVKPEHMWGHSLPANLNEADRGKLPEWLFGVDDNDEIDRDATGPDADVVAELNDADVGCFSDQIKSETEREIRIAKIFAKHGVKVEFV